MERYMQEQGNIMDFYVNGDVAPGARFNYVYQVGWSDDRYQYAEFPQGINQRIKCDVYEGVFDTIPSFFNQPVKETFFPGVIGIPGTVATNYGMRYTGFIDVPAKDAYTFYINTDLAAKLYIGNSLVVKAENGPGEQSGIIRLMPGKHAFTLDYITKDPNSKMLDVNMAGSSITKGPISASELFKYNQMPEISFKFKGVQNYFSPVDSVILINASDPDGSIEKTEVYDHDQYVGEESSPSFAIVNQGVGEHVMYARTFDNNGSMKETNVLGFTVKPAFPVPGIIQADEFRSGKFAAILNSTDADSGKNIKVAYGWVDYPIDAASAGTYHINFRVPAATGSRKITIKVNNLEVGSVEVGNTGNSQDWYDIGTDIDLAAGIQLLHLDFKGIITLHRIEISSVPTGIRPVSQEPQISVAPNPSASDFLIQSETPVNHVVVLDLLGNIVDQSPVKETNYKYRIGLDLHPGLYLLVVTTQDGVRQTIKLVKN
jgi:hypothetical protein